MAQIVKNLFSIWETQFQLLGREDSLEKEMAWRIPWTEEPGELQSMWLQRVRHNLATKQQQINSRKSLLKFWDIMSLVMLILAFKSIMSL